MGSKNRHAKHLLPIILKDRKPGQCYVEPFVGGANMIDKVDGWRIGADSHEYLIAMWKAVSDGWLPIGVITEDDYADVKNNIDTDKALSGFIGFSMSFGGKWWGGYRRDVAGTKGCVENMKLQSRRSISNMQKQAVNLLGVDFICSGYEDLEVPDNSIIYCDPPYANTTKYKDSFDHDKFWRWCRDKVKEGHQVFISEYDAPDDFACVWEKEVNSSLTKNTGAKKGVEKLFVHKSQQSV